MKELVIYFCDNIIQIIYNKKVITKELASICRGMVANRTQFMESFLNILKQEKIRSKFFGSKIYIVKDAYFHASDVFYLESIFTDLGFIQVVFLNIYDYFNEDYQYIGIFKDYIVFYLDKPVLLDLNYFKDLPKLIDFFADYYHKYLILFGTNKNIPFIQSNKLKIYYIDHYQNYIAQNLLKVKKYDV